MATKSVGRDFGYDVEFLKHYDSVIILRNDDDRSQVMVSAKYQAKVLTSTSGGINGKSFGWINYKAFTAPVDAHMNGFGGENRFWLGPEGGRFSLFFQPGKKMEFENWKTPEPFDIGAWTVVNKSSQSVLMQKEMQLKNYAGTTLTLTANRNISILGKDEIDRKIGVAISDSIHVVAYLAANSITNTGNFEWTEKTGMPCIWMLDMLSPSEKTVIVVPYRQDVVDTTKKVATTNYFGEISPERLIIRNGVVLFLADGRSRGKLGINPLRAKPVAGSYDPTNGILTITMFDLDPSAKYLNQEWTTSKPPFSGDAVNAYNDGPLADGSQMGPFYEIESVSPAAFLKPGGTLNHNHYVFHFMGSKKSLDEISKKLLGISLSDIEAAF
ncbi:MAG: DUF6786 family protein [Chitinophagaceae bacterium]